MNFTTVAMLLIAWQLLANGKTNGGTEKKKPDLSSLTGLLNDDTRSLLDCVGKLSDKNVSKEDRTGALFQMVTNPAVMNLAGNLFGGGQEGKADNNGGTAENSEGYRFKETYSDESKEFFRPIKDVADEEIKQKLYWFYDNWYL